MTRKTLLPPARAKLMLALVAAVLAAVLAISGYGTPPAHAQSVPGCNGPWGPGNWPPACWRPYADTSPFNTPLPPNPPLMPKTDEITKRIFSVRDLTKPSNDPTQGIAREGHPNHIVAHPSGVGGEPTYYSKPSDPDFTLHCEGDPYGAPDHTCPLEGKVIDIPAKAQAEGGPEAQLNPESDRHMTVVDQAAGLEYDLWQVKEVLPKGATTRKKADKLPVEGGDLYFSYGNATRIDGSGLTAGRAATAAHFASLAGRLRAEELKAGHIDHALFIVVECVNGKVWPATGDGQQCSEVPSSRGGPLANLNAPPMGARLRLNMSEADINNLNVDPWKKTVLHALREYGAFIGDTGAKGYFAIEAEAGVQYQVAGDADEWYAFGQNNWELYTGDGRNDYVAKLYNDGNDPKLGQPGYVDWEAQVWENVEVVHPDVSWDTIAPKITKVLPAFGSKGVSPRGNAYAHFSEAMRRSTINKSTFTLTRKGTTRPISASVTYDVVKKRAVLNPSRDLSRGATYVATVKGGRSGVTDLVGNPLAANKVWRFTVKR